MHRSGTSAITRILNILGLPLCIEHDLMEGWDNPRGHWESWSLMHFNNRILGVFGGSWDCPPPLKPGWQRLPSVVNLQKDAEATFLAAYPTDEWIWKDPRTCLTLPFWRPLVRPTAAVIVTRRPAAVAASMWRRDGHRGVIGAGLWERHTRSALLGARGLPVVVVRYEQLMASPAVGIAKLVTDFGKLGMRLDGDQIAARRSLKPQLQHNRGQRLRLTAPQTQLLAITEQLPAVSSTFVPPDLPPETWWMQAALTWSRDLRRSQAGLDRLMRRSNDCRSTTGGRSAPVQAEEVASLQTAGRRSSGRPQPALF